MVKYFILDSLNKADDNRGSIKKSIGCACGYIFQGSKKHGDS